jgi:hypothetical protein
VVEGLVQGRDLGKIVKKDNDSEGNVILMIMNIGLNER